MRLPFTVRTNIMGVRDGSLGESGGEGMHVCAICEHMALPPQHATGTVGVLTGLASMDRAAVDHLGWAGDEQHVVVYACPEHVVDVYRGRIEGMRMAWRLPIDPAAGRRQSPAAASASRA